MTTDEFLNFLMLVLTMTDPKDSGSIDLGKVALITIGGLIRKSSRSDAATIKVMDTAMALMPTLIAAKNDFCIVDGDPQKTALRRQKLLKLLQTDISVNFG